MKLRNKKTGEIYTACHIAFGEPIDDLERTRWKTLEEFNEDWEDYEESKEYWTIDWTCLGVTTNKYSGDDVDDFNKSIGNYFETREEAEKAVEKLQAWKRLKDKGFHWLWYNSTPEGNSVDFYLSEWDKEATRDITLLFGGEE